MVEDMRPIGDIAEDVHASVLGNGGRALPSEPADPDERPAPSCSDCLDRRWVAPTERLPVDHPDFGKAVPCHCQSQMTAEGRTSRLRRYANMGALSDLTFDTLSLDEWPDGSEHSRLLRAAIEAAREYAGDPVGWLVLTGPNGAGKTHLAASIANSCIERGQAVFFVHVPNLLDDLRSTYAPTSELSYSDLFEQVNDAPLLVMDGLGAQSPTPWAQEKLQQIFNHRANSKLPTVVTTAADLAELDPYITARIANRRTGRVLPVAEAPEPSSQQLGGLPATLRARMTFKSFDTRGKNPSAAQRSSIEAAYDAALSYAATLDGWLTFFGDTGVGKTHLAVAIANHCLEQGRDVYFAFVPELMDHLRQTYQPGSGLAYDRVFDDVKNAPLLILDDLGGEYRTDWAHEKLYQIIVHRHNLQLPTVITSPTALSEVSGPITSRIQDPSSGLLLRLDAPDFRMHRRRGGRGAPSERGRGPYAR